MVVDSDVLIDALRGRRLAQDRVALELERGDLATTSVNSFELLSGARNQPSLSKVERLLAPMRIVPFDDKAARVAGEIRRGLEAKGLGIGMADYLIAGVCLSRNAVLITNNQAHFERVPGLKLSLQGSR